MGRKRLANKGGATEQDPATPTTEPKSGNGSMSKTDAVRAALAEGIDQPEDAVKFIKERFDIDITRPQFSTYKSLSKKNGGAGGARKPGRPAKAAGATTADYKPSSNGPAGLAIQVEAIKTLVDTLGVEQVVSIARLFGK